MSESSSSESSGALASLGKAMGAVLAVEQKLSTALNVVANVLPSFPAVRIMDMDIGVPHGHAHPPNLIPPAPPVPLPSTGPIIPIPILSGAKQTLINGMPAARCGDMGLGIWCGGYVPMYEIFLGSSNVWIEGGRAARVGVDITKHCVFSSPKPADLPLGPPIGATITSSANVLIGGVPMPSLMAMAMAAAFKALGKLARAAGRALKSSSRLQRMWCSVKCVVFGAEPVNMVTGEVVVQQRDFSIPLRIPLVWTRNYGSQNNHVGVCGHGWETPADARLVFAADGAIEFHDGTLDVAVFEPTAREGPLHEPISGAVLTFSRETWSVRTKSGLTYHFKKSGETPIEALVQSITNPAGSTLHFIRVDGDLKEISDGTGRRIEVKSRRGRIEQMVLHHPDEPGPRPLVKYEYNASGELATVYDALNAPYRFFYSNHLLIHHKNRNGLSFYYKYDEPTIHGRCVHTYGDGRLYDYRFEYRSVISEQLEIEGETIITNSFGHIKVLRYDQNYFVHQEVDALGGVTRYEYDETGRTTAVVDPGEFRTEYRYDDRGNLTELVRPDGTSISTRFDDNCHPVAITDPAGGVWRQEWNARGLLSREVSPMNAVTRYEYGDNGVLMAVINAIGARTHYDHDQFGNITCITDPNGSATRYAYNGMGSAITCSDPLGRITHYDYDAIERLTRIRFATGHQVTLEYDGEGNLTRYSDQNGNTVWMKYIGLGTLVQRINADGISVHYEYDTEERLSGVVNERGQKWQFVRDAVGRIAREIDYWGHANEYRYDPSGRIVEMRDGLKRGTRFSYDALGRLVAKRDFDGTEERFSYDANGYLVLAENEATTVQRQFDADGNMVLERQGDFELRNTFDLLGRRTKRASGHGNVVEFVYDIANHVVEQRCNRHLIARTRHDACGQIAEESLGAQLRRRMAYDEYGRLVNQETRNFTEIVRRQFEYDAVGNLAKRVDARKGDSMLHYDRGNQVVEQLGPFGRQVRLEYDPAGDLQRDEAQLGTAVAGRTRTTRYGVAVYHYDAAGNQIRRETERGQTSFSWDGWNRLTSAVNEEGKLLEFGYDALGRRVYKSVDGRKTRFHWDEDVLLSEQVESAAAPREYLFREQTFEPFAIIEQTVSFFENDHMGVPHEVINEEGDLLWSASYGATGEVMQIDANRLSIPIRLQGQYYDHELTISYNRHRYFDAQIASFLSQDPIGLAGGGNPYRYGPNVWSWSDPLGLLCKWQRTWFRKYTAAGRLPRFSNRSRSYAERQLRNVGFVESGTQPGVWTHADGSYVRLDPPHDPSRALTPGARLDVDYHRSHVEPHAHKEWRNPSGATASPPSYGVNAEGRHILDDTGRLSADQARTHIITRS